MIIYNLIKSFNMEEHLYNYSEILDKETPFIETGINILAKIGENKIKKNFENIYQIEDETKKKLLHIGKKLSEKYLKKENIIKFINNNLMNKKDYLENFKKKYEDYSEKNKKYNNSKNENLKTTLNLLCILKLNKNGNLSLTPLVNSNENIFLFHTFKEENDKNKYFSRINFKNQKVYEINSNLFLNENLNGKKNPFLKTLNLFLDQKLFVKICNESISKKLNEITNNEINTNNIENLEKIYKKLTEQEIFILNNKENDINILNLDENKIKNLQNQYFNLKLNNKNNIINLND